MRRENTFVENHAPNRGMTDQGQSFHGLIHSNFRAVKPFFDRKRSREFSGFSDRFPEKTRASNAIEAKVQITSINRVPLMELPINSASRSSRDGLAAPDAEPGRSSNNTSICLDTSMLDDNILDWFLADTSVDNGFLSDSFVTPMRKAEKHSLCETLSPPSLLDDDFDQSIFEEIDAICEQSAKKVVCQEKMSFDTEIRSADKKDSGSESDVSPHGVTTVKHEPHSLAVLEPKEEIMSFFQPTMNRSMPDKYSEFLQTLNHRQREAACSDISIPLMVVAGPGSGKTSTMVGRVLMLLNEDIHQSNILAMTFTTAAAAEMRDRVAKLAGKKIAKELTISTFHSFSLQLCRIHAEKLERTSEFLVYGQGQQRRAIIEAVRLFENNTSKNDPVVSKIDDSINGLKCPDYYKDKSKKWQKFVTQAKASGKTPAECRKMGDEIGATVLENYNNILKSCDALDYHDLISCSVRLLDDYPEVLKESQCTWKAIIVDEFQDTSAMQYRLLLLLGSHNHITIVGDDDQSIFSFNGADTSGFDSFRKDFQNHKEVRLVKNYRSTRHIVEAASSLIKNNTKRCQSKLVESDNSHGSKITVKESYNEEAQCAFVVDKILESISDSSMLSCSYGNIAILYRRQVSGKVFQAAFRDRKIPFNVHGVAFYRKKVVRIIFSMLKTTLSECDDAPFRRVFKALLPYEKEEKKTIIEHIDKISTIRKSSFISAAKDIFRAKISGTFKRSQLTQGRKVLSTLEMLSKLVHREQSLSAVLTSVANMVPQKYLLEQRAVLDVDGGKLLNENNDLRSVHQYLMDDVSDFLSAHFSSVQEKTELISEQNGCTRVLKAFIDYIVERETENFRSRRYENNDSVTLTTIHQSKGLEWDIVFIVKANETEIPLLHESNGAAQENGTSLEEERRLLYVALTRARKKVFILYVTVDSNWQVLQPSRFLKEIPSHLLEIQGDLDTRCLGGNYQGVSKEPEPFVSGLTEENNLDADTSLNNGEKVPSNGAPEESIEAAYAFYGNLFLKRFNVENRSIVSHLFHNWAKKKAFQDPRRLLDKVRFVIEERLTNKKNKHKDVLRALKTSLCCDEAFHYAEQIIRWEQIPADQRAHLMREKQEHFQRLRLEKSMSSSEPTSKQISYLKNLGCTTTPTSRLHASRLIEQYKSL